MCSGYFWRRTCWLKVFVSKSVSWKPRRPRPVTMTSSVGGSSRSRLVEPPYWPSSCSVRGTTEPFLRDKQLVHPLSFADNYRRLRFVLKWDINCCMCQKVKFFNTNTDTVEWMFGFRLWSRQRKTVSAEKSSFHFNVDTECCSVWFEWASSTFTVKMVLCNEQYCWVLYSRWITKLTVRILSWFVSHRSDNFSVQQKGKKITVIRV